MGFCDLRNKYLLIYLIYNFKDKISRIEGRMLDLNFSIILGSYWYGGSYLNYLSF